MELAAGLDQALRRAGIPIAGVSIGSLTDRSTWRVLYAPIATDQQRTDGAALVASYDLATDTVGSDADVLAQFNGMKWLKALGIATAQRLGVPIATFRGEVIAAFKALP